MIMHDLYNTPRFASVEVNTADALVIIDEMITDGVHVQTRDFRSPAGDNVVIFWTTPSESPQVGTLWEHTFETLRFNVPPLHAADDSAARVESDRAAVADYVQSDRSEYATGE